jgi:DNA-binding CsgD family transcriptional regulator
MVIDGDCVELLPPSQALSQIIESAADRARRAYEQLLSVSRAVPHLVADSTRDPQVAHADAVAPIDGEVVLAGSTADTLTALIERTTGELLWLRPDQWTLPWEEEMRRLIAEGVLTGRQVRGIYPIRALTDAPAVLQSRQEVGEQIRLLPQVPTRLLVIGSSHAVLPDPLGSTETTPRIVVRQRGIVEGFVLYFEQLWAQASPLLEYERGVKGSETRRQLLLQLSDGAQDEQIARRLGMSLRTVRRRVAELMVELGAESRFQAGVEAARRGWL